MRNSNSSQPLGAGILLKLIFILLVLVFSLELVADSAGFSLSVRSPKDDSKPVDYEIGIDCHLDSLLLLDVTYERQNGNMYRNLELFSWRYWKFIQFFGKFVSIEEDDLKIISVDARLKHESHSVGVAESWDLKPSTMFVVGEEVRWNTKLDTGSSFVDFIGNSIQKIEFWGISNLYTKDFRSFYNETEIRLSARVSAIVGLYYSFKQRYYDRFIFSSKAGIQVDF